MEITKDKLTQGFLDGIEEIEKLLLTLQFKPYSFDKKGFAYFVQYQRGAIIVEFLFGPSDYQVEMIVFAKQSKFAFKDLLQIPVISKWVDANRYVQKDGRNIKNELLWFVALLKETLSIIDQQDSDDVVRSWLRLGNVAQSSGCESRLGSC